MYRLTIRYTCTLNSAATYATCCKKHAAAPKPPIRRAAAKPAVLKSRFFPKPLTTGQLQQGQVKGVDANLDSQKVRTRPLQDLLTPTTPPTTQAPSGGGGSGQIKGPEIRRWPCLPLFQHHLPYSFWLINFLRSGV